jgi:hypothetical protein
VGKARERWRDSRETGGRVEGQSGHRGTATLHRPVVVVSWIRTQTTAEEDKAVNEAKRQTDKLGWRSEGDHSACERVMRDEWNLLVMLLFVGVGVGR